MTTNPIAWIGLLATTVPAVAEQPTVVLIGDSIRMGYEPTVRAELAADATVVAPTENCRHSGEVLRNLQAWVLAARPRLVHLNAGLHEIYRNPDAPPQLSVAQYTANLEAIFRRLAEAQIPAVWSTTTPVIDAWYHRAKGYACRWNRDVVTYNEAAAGVLAKYRIPVLDLYQAVSEQPAAASAALYAADGVHFNAAGCQFLGRRVAEFVRQHLADPLPRRPFRCLYNFEMLLLCNQYPLTAAAAGAYFDKLAGSAVDAVMLCPQAWRASLWPSTVDPSWRQPQGPAKVYPASGFAYLQAGGDPVADLLAVARRQGRGCFLSYRMNDFHHVDNRHSPTHPQFWKQHPEYWLGDRDENAYGCQDHRRLHNYALAPVREWYLALLTELLERYDVDGLELDFMRCLRYFHDAEIDAGRPLLTDFVGRVRAQLDRCGQQRGRRLELALRLPPEPAMAAAAGLDLATWAARGWVDRITVAPQFTQTTELDIEGYRSLAPAAFVHGELNFLLAYQQEPGSTVQHYRLTNFPTYRAAAHNLLARGADGVSVFNYDYARPTDRSVLPEGLRGLTDQEFLSTADKCYSIYRAHAGSTLPAYNQADLQLHVPDDLQRAPVQAVLLRLETERPLAGQRIVATLNDTPLTALDRAQPELFPPLSHNPANASPARVRCFAVPPAALRVGLNKIHLENLDQATAACRFWSLELAIDRTGATR
ncbi:MAG: hypothetical protein IT204_12405 [Fimbriimonadaceae bacterium]|nr:hypothetical protein [Fimbriimonadaceae bacterium]